MFDLRLNGFKVGFTLTLETEPGEGWKGSRFIGHYETLEELNNAIYMVEVPLYWRLKVDLNGEEE